MDQAQTGPGSGGGERGLGEDPTRLEASATPGLREKARESVRDAREQVMTQVRERTDSARQGATRMVDERKQTLSGSVHALASAIDAAAASLSDGNQSRLAEWTRELSGRAHRIASYLDEHDTRGLVTDLEGSARSHPAAFIGTSFAAGLAAGRFLRATSRSDDASGVTGEQSVGFEFHADDALLAGDTGSTSRGGGYGNPGSGYGTTGSSLGATRSGPGDGGFGPTLTAPGRSGTAGTGHIGTGGAALASRAAGSAPIGSGTGGLNEGGSIGDDLKSTDSDGSSTSQRPAGGHGEGGL